MSYRCSLSGGVLRRSFCLGFVLLSAQANEYSFEYGVEAGYEYNDNVRLTPEDELDISGGRLAIPATLTSRSERLNAQLIGELLFSRFDEDAWDSDDQNSEGRLPIRWSVVNGWLCRLSA